MRAWGAAVLLLVLAGCQTADLRGCRIYCPTCEKISLTVTQDRGANTVDPTTTAHVSALPGL